MQERNQIGLAALLLAPLWVGAASSRCQGVPQQDQHLDASAQEHIRQLISTLPPDSLWRNLLENHVTGDGIRQPWMDHMRRDGIKLAIFTYDFVWIREDSKVTDWTLAGMQYFRDYDEAQPVTDPRQLALFRHDGLDKELEAVALPRAKTGHRVDAQPETGTLGYHSVCLADEEWLPVTSRSQWMGFYPPGLTPLMRASLLGDTGRIQRLLSEGANVNEVSDDGSTALMWAAAGSHPDALEALLKAGANVSATGKDGATALMAAAANDRPKNLEILLKAGADPNVRDAQGGTALSIATSKHYDDIVQLLRRAGARE
jgi:hypothetical protein